MTVQRVFLILTLLLITGSVCGYLFLYKPITIDLESKKTEYLDLNSRLKNAQQAKVSMQGITTRLQQAEDRLKETKSHFIRRTQLSEVTTALTRLAKKHNVRVKDFSPVLDTYFDDNGPQQIRPLTTFIIVTGSFLNVGRFIENWSDLEFYMVPDKVIFEKLDPASNDLTVTITTRLFTWNE